MTFVYYSHNSCRRFFPIQSFKFFWNVRQLAVNTPAPQLVTCEVGFGSGMSTAIVLSATSSASDRKVGGHHYVFSIETQHQQRAYLEQVFGSRMHFILGDSTETIPAFAKANPGLVCDFVSIDGAHDFPTVSRTWIRHTKPPNFGLFSQVYYDIVNMHAFAKERTLLMMDDMQSWGVRRSFRMAADAGYVGTTQEFSAEKSSLDWTFSSIL